ncbi:MAG: hypothetical protein PF588_04945 [Candidatus Kapabacteria bacterium]|jgi:hypothetical protein|nr:hypothetical protein [Candidatus Kapabacteria bacterium]
MLKKFSLILIILVLLFGLNSCYTYTPPQQAKRITKTQLYDLSYNAVWTSLVEFFAINSLPLDILDKDSGLISTKDFKIKGLNWCDCGNWKDMGGEFEIKDKYGAHLEFNIFVKEKNGNIKVLINMTYRGVDKNLTGMAQGGYDGICYSTGELENMIFDYIKNN